MSERAGRPVGAVRDRLIIALDLPTLTDAERVVATLRPVVAWFKVGAELFTNSGPTSVAMVHAHGGWVFLDLKYHDIPSTVAGAVGAATHLGVEMLTVHVAGGRQMLEEAVAAVRRGPLRLDRDTIPGSRPLLLGVTLLTSAETSDGPRSVLEAAQVACECGLDGVIASAREAAGIKRACGQRFLVVTPGIRLLGTDAQDQRRIATPMEALREGADYLVVGRPIVGAPAPREALMEVLSEMEEAVQV